MRFFRKSLIGLLLLSISLGLIAYAGQMVSTALDERMSKPARKAKQRERVFAVNVVAAEAKTETPMLSAFGEIQRLLYEDVVILPMYERGFSFVVDSRLQNFRRRSVGPEVDYNYAYIDSSSD